MEHYKEFEYKYDANKVSLSDFTALIEGMNPLRRLDVSSWDHYYTTPKDENIFQRYRASKDKPELTKKRKTKDTNNWQRIEVDLPLHPDVSENIVRKFVSLDEYEPNFTIYKSCFIYFLENLNFVYYTVYNEEMKEKGRFIEVEVNKDKVTELGEEESLKLLKDGENQLASLGINAKNRLKKSLFEIFRK